MKKMIRYAAHLKPIFFDQEESLVFNNLLPTEKQALAPDFPQAIQFIWLDALSKISQCSVDENVLLPEYEICCAVSEVHQQFIFQQKQVYEHFLFALQKINLPGDVPSEETLPGPKFSRRDLEELASSTISSHFGEWFKPLDQYDKLIRLPEPPLLLADRVTGIDVEPNSMQKGTIWTETDVRADSWYLHHNRMPAAIMIEAGQADLLLVSWLGFDFHNRGNRVYRLLGCELNYQGSIPESGDTLCYEIQINGFAKHGDIYLFFFQYDCRINGELRLKVRNGQAGFFTDAELADSGGVLWSAETTTLEENLPLDLPKINCIYSAFNSEQIKNFSQGKIVECFGPGFEITQCHTRTPCISGDRMLLMDEITHFDVKGGPWQRGYMRAVKSIHPDDWFFKGHFKNDPCMPGTLMLEASLQVMATYLTALGYTLDKDGWRFEPVPHQTYHLRCRGQVTPVSKQISYEIFIRSVVAEPLPTLTADILCSVDGLKVFHTTFSLRLVPDWPLNQHHPLIENYIEQKSVSEIDGFRFDYASLLACAWGRPSTAFGPLYQQFDNHRRLARLPGPPYHFMSRITQIKGEMNCFKPGVFIECEYDIPPDAWYFQENSSKTMPFCVLLEAALQPCGWLAVFIGSPLITENDLSFRNLDGTGLVKQEVYPNSGTLRTQVTCIQVSRSGGTIIESFNVKSFLGDQLVYQMDTVFGFFLKESLEKQIGLSATDNEKMMLDAPANFCVDLTEQPADFFEKIPRLPLKGLLMIDRITGFWPQGGSKSLGFLRAEKTVKDTDWYFKAHFFQDPVQPGSLGVEAMIQMLQFFILQQKFHENKINPRLESIATDCEVIWKYRGQVAPKNKQVIFLMDITEIHTDDQQSFVKADAALWVDGVRIYEVKNLGARVVSDLNVKNQKMIEKRIFDPQKEPWVYHHCPNYLLPTLPMMTIVDFIANAASQYFPTKKLITLEEVQVLAWVVANKMIQFHIEVLLQENNVAHVKLYIEESEKQQLVAKGIARFADDYSVPNVALESLTDLELIHDPYHTMFHGPAFHVMQSLSRGKQGALSVLNAVNEQVPFGYLNQALLDGATHAHALPDNLTLWSNEIPFDQVGYPSLIPKMEFFSTSPRDGVVHCETKFAGFHYHKRFPKFEIILIADGKMWAKLQLVDALFPKGTLGMLSAENRRAFLQDKKYIPDIQLSRIDDHGYFYLTLQEVQNIDWIPGSVAALYGVNGVEGDLANMARQILIKEYVANLLKVHPSEISVDKNNLATHPSEPRKKYQYNVTQQDDKFILIV